MVSATGIGSGLDIEALVTQLVDAERTPVSSRLTSREAKLTSELSAFGAYKGALASFQSSLSQLTNLSTFGQREASSSDDSIATISAGAAAETGSYDLSVTQLAKAHSLASGSYSAVTDTVGTGTITIRVGTTDYVSPDPGPESYNSFTVNPDVGVATITIDSSNNTLEGLRDAINDADIGASATIVNDGSGYRLLLNSTSTGAENSLEITVDDTGDSNDTDDAGLSSFAFNSSAINLGQTQAAQDSAFTINGLSISSSENTISSVIDGVDLTLNDVSGTSSVTLQVTENQAAVKTAITDFVDVYNNFVGLANSLTSYDADTSAAGILQGDFSARSVSSQLRSILSNAVEGFNAASFNSLSEIGITTQADGTLSVDSTELDTALSNNFDEIVGLFAAVGFPTDGNVEFASSEENTVAGNYAVNITQLASQGQLVGGSISFPLDIDDDNDEFSIKVNGTTSGSISLTQGNYTSGADLADEIQARINGDSELSSANVTVTVTFDTDHFEITSDSYGSSSTVEILTIDANTSSELGLSVAVGTDGVDVAGTIGGLTATGSGQILTGGVGTDTEGLKLSITGDDTGFRGMLAFSQGIAYQLDNLITSFLESDGILDSRTDGIQERIDDIEGQREDLDYRMELIEARYRAQFNALDSLLAQMQNTSDFLTQQLAALPQAGALVNRNN